MTRNKKKGPGKKVAETKKMTLAKETIKDLASASDGQIRAGRAGATVAGICPQLTTPTGLNCCLARSP